MYLIGAGGHAKVIYDILLLREIRVKGFIEDDPSKTNLWDLKVVGNTQSFDASFQPAIISIGNNRIRKEIASKLDIRYERAIHPSAILGRQTRVGEGSVLMAGVVINSDTILGKHVIVNTGASVDHDCRISDYVHIAPGSTLCGGITIGEGAFIGAGATVLPNISIGAWATVGGGAVVTKDVPAGSTVMGCPARTKN